MLETSIYPCFAATPPSNGRLTKLAKFHLIKTDLTIDTLVFAMKVRLQLKDSFVPEFVAFLRAGKKVGPDLLLDCDTSAKCCDLLIRDVSLAISSVVLLLYGSSLTFYPLMLLSMIRRTTCSLRCDVRPQSSRHLKSPPFSHILTALLIQIPVAQSCLRADTHRLAARCC